MCVIRAYGKRFDAETFANRTTLPVVAVHRRGQPLYPRRGPRSPKAPRSGIVIRVSRASWDDLPKQIRGAERFLRKHAAQLIRLGRNKHLDSFVLDFPINLRIGTGRGGRKIVIQSDRFPSSLVTAAARLGLALELTVYG